MNLLDDHEPLLWSTRAGLSRTVVRHAVRRAHPSQPYFSETPATIRVALSLGEVIRWGLARELSSHPFSLSCI